MVVPASEPEVRVLQPRPWVLPEPPPLAPPPPAPEPLVLLVDRRRFLDPPALQALAASLSPAERQRHAVLGRPADRERFLLARGGLRQLLAAWLGCPAAAVPIEAGDHGKPHCPGGPAFNLSHSGDLILFALHPHRAVGVDVERLRPGLHWQPIARRVLPEGRQLALAALPAAARLEGFLQAWCHLEAELKAGGAGFAGIARLRDAAASAERLPQHHWRLALPAGYRGAACLQLG